MARLFSYAFLLYFVLTSAVFFTGALLVWLLTVAFDRRLALLHLFGSFWGSFYLWTLPGVRTHISGRERIDRKTAYVMVSNHQSLLDTLAAYHLFVPFKFVAKAELFKLPFIGWNMTLNRYIRVERTSASSIRKMLAACERMLEEGNAVYIFPEGTRASNVEVGRFRPGAFALAQKLHVPVLPIAITGTRAILPKNSLVFGGRHHIHVRVLDPIPPEALSGLSPEEAGALVRERIVVELERLALEGPQVEQTKV